MINAAKLNYSVLSGRNQWHQYGNLRHRQQIFENTNLQKDFVGRRNYGMLVGRVLRGALKLRYLLLGAGVGGTVTLNKVTLFKAMTTLFWNLLSIFRNMNNGEMDFQI